MTETPKKDMEQNADPLGSSAATGYAICKCGYIEKPLYRKRCPSCRRKLEDKTSECEHQPTCFGRVEACEAGHDDNCVAYKPKSGLLNMLGNALDPAKNRIA